MAKANAERVQVWKGSVGAVALSWLSFVCVNWVSFSLMGLASPRPGRAPTWAWIGFALVWLAAFPIISGVAGLVCAWFWHPIARREQCTKWGARTFFAVLAPACLSLFCCLGLLVYWPCLLVFSKGLDYGYKWWPRREWRTFFGLRNQWEREDEEPL